ncbi:uncharacterized protein LOC126267801 [Schistocerca gregaria]|uniref:uncharacterized protein LOC126267801 n=1 Tax=Schistocerca gregaria TaxID=7010 RepID=UPI00211E1723|nr:uncharacterized protein LOC126267801 [Schistocerca gregaria]
MHAITPEAPNDLVCVDHYGPLLKGQFGQQFIFVVVDAFTKHVRLYATNCTTMKSCVNILMEDYVRTCGKPKSPLRPCPIFTSPRWKAGLEKEGIKVTVSLISNPQSNPAEQ